MCKTADHDCGKKVVFLTKRPWFQFTMSMIPDLSCRHFGQISYWECRPWLAVKKNITKSWRQNGAWKVMRGEDYIPFGKTFQGPYEKTSAVVIRWPLSLLSSSNFPDPTTHHASQASQSQDPNEEAMLRRQRRGEHGRAPRPSWWLYMTFFGFSPHLGGQRVTRKHLVQHVDVDIFLTKSLCLKISCLTSGDWTMSSAFKC